LRFPGDKRDPEAISYRRPTTWSIDQAPRKNEENVVMTPLDLRSREEWEEILDRLARDVNMTACLTDDKGAVLFCRRDRFPLCAAVRGNQDALTYICSQRNTIMLATVGKTLKPALDCCEAGLLRLVVPVLADGALVGQITSCGLQPKGEEPETFLVAKQLGISEEEVGKLAESTPVGEEEELRIVADRLFDQLSSA
jgi:ligand-binding sensor protein